MALVRCTKVVHDHIVTKIEELFRDRILAAYKLRNMAEEDVGLKIYHSVHTPERLAAMKLVEQAFVNHSISSESTAFRFTLRIEEPKTNRTFHVALPKPYVMLDAFSRTWGNNPDIVCTDPEIKKEVIDAKLRLDAVTIEREEFKKAFEAAWTAVNSVNELIKLWPAVIELLPAGVMDRINHKPGPRTKQAELFDATVLNVSLLKAKVAK